MNRKPLTFMSGHFFGSSHRLIEKFKCFLIPQKKEAANFLVSKQLPAQTTKKKKTNVTWTKTTCVFDETNDEDDGDITQAAPS